MLRSPLDGADGTPVLPGLSPVVVVLVGSTGFDGTTRTAWWQTGFGLQGDAVERAPGAQDPLLAVLVGCTVGGLALLLG